MSLVGSGSEGGGIPAPFSMTVGDKGQLQLFKGDELIQEQDETGAWIANSVRTGTGSLHLGELHSLGSGNENLVAVNNASGIAWYPAWGGVALDGSTEYPTTVRAHGATVASAGNGNTNYDSSVDYSYTFTAPDDRVFYGVALRCAETYSGRLRWRVVRENDLEVVAFNFDATLAPNSEFQIPFKYPLWATSGQTFTLSLTKEDGTLLKVRAGLTNPAEPWRRNTTAPYVDHEVYHAGNRGKLFTIGDVKQSYQKEDHDGWYKLDGRATGSLPEKALHAAFALGMPGLMPNMSDKTVYGAGGDSSVGQMDGGNLINRASLPNVGLSFSGTSAANNRGHTHQVDPPATASGIESASHTHSIPGLEGRTWWADAVPLGQRVALTSGTWSNDIASNLPGTGRAFAYTEQASTIESHSLSHRHPINTDPSTTGGVQANHTHTTNIPEFASKSESQNHTHAYSGTTTSMNGGVTQLPFMPAHLKLNYFVYLGE